ncbi:hypothetical protein D3C87_77720 [compost metagenome]
MPVSPDEVLKLTEDDEKMLEKIQIFIDEYVVKNFSGDNYGTGGSINIPLEKDFLSVKSKIKRKICNNYKNVGWKQADFDSSKFFLSTHERNSSFNGRD